MRASQAVQKEREDRAKAEWDLLQRNEEYRANKALMAKAKADYDEQQRKLNDDAKELERQRQQRDADTKAKFDELSKRVKQLREQQRQILGVSKS